MELLFELRDDFVLISTRLDYSWAWSYWGSLPLETFHSDHNEPWYKNLQAYDKVIVTMNISLTEPADKALQ